MSYMFFDYDRHRVEQLIADGMSTTLNDSAQYDSIYIHKFFLKLTKARYDELKWKSFSKHNINYKQFTLYRSKSQKESDEFRDFLIHRIDGVSEDYNDPRNSACLYYRVAIKCGEYHKTNVEFCRPVYYRCSTNCAPLLIDSRSTPDSLKNNLIFPKRRMLPPFNSCTDARRDDDRLALNCHPVDIDTGELYYLRDIGSRLITFRTGLEGSDYTDMMGYGLWYTELDRSGTYYLGTLYDAPINDITSFDPSKCKINPVHFIMFMSISNTRNIYDIRDVKKLAEKFNARIKYDERVGESFINPPRVI